MSDNDCVDVVDEVDVVGRVTTMVDPSSCDCSELGGVHDSIIGTCNVSGGIEFSCIEVCLMTISDKSSESS